MTYLRQRTVKDGEALVKRDDSQQRDATKGILIHAEDVDGKAIPVKVTDEKELVTFDESTHVLLSRILQELEKTNKYLEYMCDGEI